MKEDEGGIEGECERVFERVGEWMNVRVKDWRSEGVSVPSMN